MIIPMNDLLIRAKEQNIALAAPNAIDMGTVRVIFEVAKESNIPIIIDCAGIDIIEPVADAAKFYERKYPEVNVALNLDHGSTFEEAIVAIRSGFSSVMVDRSQLPYEENVREVSEIVRIAHAVGVSVEAELGHVGIGKDYLSTRDSGLTNPDQAKLFVEETNIDCLAIAIGTSHGTYQGKPRIDYDLLKLISRNVEIPLVLHGGSGTGDDNLIKCIKNGIQKINLFTDISAAGINNILNYLSGNMRISKEDKTGEFAINNVNLYDAFEIGLAGYKEKLKHYVSIFSK